MAYDVDNPFERQVNKNSDMARKRSETVSQFQKEEVQYKKSSRVRQNQRRKKEKHRKKVFKRVIAAALAAIASLTIAYGKGVNDLRKVGYGDLNDAGCYVKNDVDNSALYTAFESEILYGQVNPLYQEAQPEDYTRMAEILSSNGYTDPQITIILNDLCGIQASNYVYGDDIPTIDEIIVAGIEGTNGLEKGKSSGRGM